MKALIATAIALTVLAAPAAALEPLAQEKYINDRLIAARIADRVRRKCPTIDGRLIYAYSEARKLMKYARNKGYSQDQIDAFIDSKPEKKRIYGIADQYLADNGAKPDDAESYCRIGRQEIARKSVIGSLLSAR